MKSFFIYPIFRSLILRFW